MFCNASATSDAGAEFTLATQPVAALVVIDEFTNAQLQEYLRAGIDEVCTRHQLSARGLVEALQLALARRSGRRLELQQRCSKLGSATAHSLNNLITTVRGNARLLAAEEADDDRLDMLQEVLDACARASMLAQNLQTLALSPTPRADGQQLNLLTELQCAVTVAGRLLPAGIALTTDFSGLARLDNPVLLSCPIEGLWAVLLNLIANASDALRGAGEISLAVSIEQVSLAVEKSGRSAQVHLTIEDFGPGIGELNKNLVPDPLSSTHATTNRAGLGFAMVRRFVQHYGNALTLGASEMGGLRISLRLPVTMAPRLAPIALQTPRN